MQKQILFEDDSKKSKSNNKGKRNQKGKSNQKGQSNRSGGGWGFRGAIAAGAAMYP